eukprot:scaffold4225_cov18-Prasinocladus_malaysianus.AAC.3
MAVPRCTLCAEDILLTYRITGALGRLSVSFQRPRGRLRADFNETTVHSYNRLGLNSARTLRNSCYFGSGATSVFHHCVVRGRLSAAMEFACMPTSR